MLKTKILGAVAALVLVTGCATGPDVNEMTQLTNDELRKVLVGNTFTYRADWGEWTEIYRDDLTGVGRATGSFPTETAEGVSRLVEGGEICTIYTGEAIWSKAEYEYCKVVYTNAEGQYVFKSTRNDRRPERVGQTHVITVIPGDGEGLLN